MKILYVTSTLKKSGPTNQLYSLLKYLMRDDKITSYLITLSDTDKENRQVDFEKLGVEVINLQNSRFAGLFKNKKLIEKLIQNIKPDIVHSQGIRADSIVSRISHLKTVSTVHNYPNEDYIFTYGKLQGKLMVMKHVKSLKKFNDIIAVSNSVKNNLISKFYINNVSAVRNGIDEDYYFSLPDFEKIKLKKKLKLPIDSRIWISTGHLNGRKNPLFAIESFINTFGENNDHVFLLLGDGNLMEECKSVSKGYSNIKLFGRVNNVAEYLQASDFFISASKAEGLPMAAIEAIACGLPLILSNIEPHNELLNLEKKIGFGFRNNSLKGLENALEEANAADYFEIRKNNLDVFKKYLSAVVMANQYKNKYKSLLS